MATGSVIEVGPRRLRPRTVSRADDSWERSPVERIVAGDDSALATMYDQFGAVVYGVAVRLVGIAHAADICQEVFLALWDHPERFDPARGSLQGFLVTIGRRRCIDLLRRDGRRASTEDRARSVLQTTAPNVEEAAIAMVGGARVRAALDHLPEPQRRAIELAYFDGLAFRQVAVVTATSEGTAKSRIRLGLRRLAIELHEEVERA